jgi:hypothetical protein
MYGPAVTSKKILASWRRAVLHQCIRPSIGALLRAIMDISAAAIALVDPISATMRLFAARIVYSEKIGFCRLHSSE